MRSQFAGDLRAFAGVRAFQPGQQAQQRVVFVTHRQLLGREHRINLLRFAVHIRLWFVEIERR
jgi:hypothetical protein